MIEVRHEKPEDYDAIRHVNELAFKGKSEADLVDALRDSGEYIISMVAIQDDKVVGHILFSPVNIINEEDSNIAMGLGPMSVLPEHQRQGIGSRLARVSLGECKLNGYPLVIVLGHPGYYPRFGFKPSKPLGIEWEKEVPEEVFMVVELEEGALDGIAGIVKYHAAFENV